MAYSSHILVQALGRASAQVCLGYASFIGVVPGQNQKGNTTMASMHQREEASAESLNSGSGAASVHPGNPAERNASPQTQLRIDEQFVSKLEKLFELRACGILSSDEYQAQKSKLIAEAC